MRNEQAYEINTFKQNASDKNVYVSLSYDEIRELSDESIQENLQAYTALANVTLK